MKVLLLTGTSTLQLEDENEEWTKAQPRSCDCTGKRKISPWWKWPKEDLQRKHWWSHQSLEENSMCALSWLDYDFCFNTVSFHKQAVMFNCRCTTSNVSFHRIPRNALARIWKACLHMKGSYCKNHRRQGLMLLTWLTERTGPMHPEKKSSKASLYKNWWPNTPG